MSTVTKYLDKLMPMFERLGKIKKFFSSTKTFWTVTSTVSLFILSQFIAMIWDENFSAMVKAFFKDAPSWIMPFIELGISYFEKSGEPIYVIGGFLLIILFLVGKYLDGKSVSSTDIKTITDNQEKMLEDKKVENYLIIRIEKLEAELLVKNSEPSISEEELSQLNEKLIILKSKLYALQIDDSVIDEAQKIIDNEQREGVSKALALIEESNSDTQLQKLREQNQKQSKICRYKAGLYEWINQWEKADENYQTALEFNPNFENNFKYAYFLQLHRANFNDAEKFYLIALQKTEELSKKAIILNNLANSHSKDSTKRAEALKEYEEALEIRRVLAKENSKVCLPDVATSLNNLANFHSKDNTKRAKALKEYEEALAIYRNLAKENSKVYLPYVAISLNNLAAFHSKDSTKRAEVLKEYEEALEIRRDLAKENPKVYLPYVATSLNNLGLFHSKDNTKRAEALKEYQEALEIRRDLAKENPKVYLPYVAISLNNLAVYHSTDSTKRAEALKVYKEGLAIYRDLAKENLKVYGRDCANTLVMGVYLLGDVKEHLDEALHLLEVYPDSYMNVGWLRQTIGKLKKD